MACAPFGARAVITLLPLLRGYAFGETRMKKTNFASMLAVAGGLAIATSACSAPAEEDTGADETAVAACAAACGADGCAAACGAEGCEAAACCAAACGAEACAAAGCEAAACCAAACCAAACCAAAE